MLARPQYARSPKRINRTRRSHGLPKVRVWPSSDLRFGPPNVCYWGKVRNDVWAASPSGVGYALVSGIDPRPEPPLAGVSAHSAIRHCLARASVRSQPYGMLQDGVRELGRPSSQRVLEQSHRDRNGLTLPTSLQSRSLSWDNPHVAWVTGGFPKRKSVSSTHIRCKMIASLRATAMRAFLAPMRLASLTPQARSVSTSFVGVLRFARALH